MDWEDAKKKLLEDEGRFKAYYAWNWSNFTYWLNCKWTDLILWWRWR